MSQFENVPEELKIYKLNQIYSDFVKNLSLQKLGIQTASEKAAAPFTSPIVAGLKKLETRGSNEINEIKDTLTHLKNIADPNQKKRIEDLEINTLFSIAELRKQLAARMVTKEEFNSDY